MIILILVLLGLCFGSFVNALVWRLYKQSTVNSQQSTAGKLKAVNSKLSTDYSILKGRSICPKCQHILAPNDLIPVLSWVWLKGKCRYCRAPISPQYPLVELLTAGLFIVSYLYWPFVWTSVGLTLFVLWLPILVILIALFVYDLKWMLLPNRLVFPLIGLSSAFAVIRLLGGETALVNGILMTGLSIAVVGGLFEGLYIISGGKWIGGGDVKLGVAIGLILMRPDFALLMLFAASLAGTLAALPAYLRGQRKNARIPFGPHLIFATVLVFFLGAGLIDFVANQLLINSY